MIIVIIFQPPLTIGIIIEVNDDNCGPPLIKILLQALHQIIFSLINDHL